MPNEIEVMTERERIAEIERSVETIRTHIDALTPALPYLLHYACVADLRMIEQDVRRLRARFPKES